MAATYTVKQVAQILGYSTNSIYTFLKEKQIRGVRVGKGRFRIPQSEIDRLLLQTGKKPVTETTALTPRSVLPAVASPDGIMEVPDTALTAHHIHLFGAVRLTLPNLFDWFIGTAAVITGLALFLFNKSFESSAVLAVAPLIAAMRMVLIAAGLGVLITTFTGNRNRAWHKIFQSVLVVGGAVMIAMLFKVRDIDGVFIYGTLAVTIVIAMVMQLPGIASFLLYLTLLALSAPLIPLLGPEDPHVTMTLTRLGTTPGILSLVLAVSGIAIMVSLWVGYGRHQRILTIVSWLVAAASICAAFFYAQGSFWSRAFHFIVLGLTAMFLPSWIKLRYTKSRREQLIVHTIFGMIFFILVVAVVVIGLMQGNLVEQTKGELLNKVRVGQTFLQDEVGDIRDAVTGAASNQELVTAVAKSDETTMTLLSKLLYESNGTIRRVVILDKDGKGVSLYPFGTFDVDDLSFRDYYKVPKETSRPYLSDVFEALVDQSHRKVLVVAAPLLDKDSVFQGVLAGSIDVEEIGTSLMKIATETRGEYFSVVDAEGARLIHPDPTAIGEVISQEDIMRRGLAGEEALGEGALRDGRRGMVATAPLSVMGKGWAISVRMPVGTVTILTQWANITVLSLVVASVVIAGGLIALLHTSRGRREDTS